MKLQAVFQKDESLLKDIASSKTNKEGFRLWWLGQSGFLLQWQGKYLLFDPYLSDSLTHKYAATDKPHVRMYERVIDPALLPFIDVVTSSHNHTDHLDAETLLPLVRTNPQISMVIPEANRTFVSERLGCALDWPIGMNDHTDKDVKGFRFYGIPAAHDEIERDVLGQLRYMGFVVEFGEYRIYHSGDTRWFEGIEEWLIPFEPTIALLPINGYAPERRVAGNLNGEEAARLGRAIGAKLTVPHHYDMFQFNTADVRLFIQEAERYQTPYKVLQQGEALSFR
jgi:L-ascorbate metabolism protein UlaG (beta-lactamase superfamily)